jgi:hypothetical protein
MRALKVWGGGLYMRQLPDGTEIPFNQTPRALVCAETKKRAMELLNQITFVRRSEFDSCWSETRNEVELKVAKAEGVWINLDPSAWAPRRKGYMKLK